MDKTLYRNGRPLKIALIGGARTGKDTIANYLRSTYNFKRLAFGDAMKDYLYRVFPNLPKDPKPREEMIAFAQACRSIDPLVWVNHLDKDFDTYKLMGYQNFIITDVRQQNEIDYCKANGYLIVKVESSQANQVERAGNEDLDPSNVLDSLALSFNDYDLKIENNGSIIELYKKIEEIVKEG